MNIAFYAGRSGLMAHSDAINISAHNIANASTIGYKTTTPEFRELVFNDLDQNKNKELQENQKMRVGHGVKIQQDSLQFSQGVLSSTDFEFDFAIASGNSLFAVERAGEVQFTRNGAFNLSVEGDGNYLVTSDGGYVLDNNFERIRVPYDENMLPDSKAAKEMLGIFSFDNPYGLFRVDGQSFLPTDISGEPRVAADDEYELRQGMVERSNINLAKEMSDVIVTQKAYQFSAKVVQTADEMEDVINNLRR